MGKNTVQAKKWLHKRNLDSALLETMVKRCYADFKHGCTDTNDAEHCLPKFGSCPGKHQKLHKLVSADRKLKLHEIAEELKISEGSIFTILHEHLSMRVLCLLTADQKQ